MMMQDSSFTKSMNALQQVVARKGRPLLICPEGKIPSTGDASVHLDSIEVPHTVDCLQVSTDPPHYIRPHTATNTPPPQSLPHRHQHTTTTTTTTTFAHTPPPTRAPVLT